MQEIQQLRRIAVKLGTSGTAIPIAETRLYKGGFGFVVLQCYVPNTQNRSPTTSPLCTVFRSTVDGFGNRKQFNKDIYNMLYVGDAEIENAKYMVFECPLPIAFTDTVGDLEMVFTYSEINADNKAVARLASGVYRTNVGDSDVSDGEVINPLGGELARLNDITVKVEQLEDSVDALLQPPDNTDASKVGTPNVELTDDGRLKFNELKGETGDKGETGEITVGKTETVEYDKPAKVTNSGTTTDAVLDFEIPQGKPAFVKVGMVVTLPPGSEACVVNVGTENDPILDFYIPEGVGFRVSKTYASIDAMNAGFVTDDVPLYGFVMINTGNVEDAENAMLFMKTPTEYEYLTDLSGAQGIQGERGQRGVGIADITPNGQDEKGGNKYSVILEDGKVKDIVAPKGDKGDVGDLSETVPLMDGEAEVGSASNCARGDHRHPTNIRSTTVSISTSAWNGANQATPSIDFVSASNIVSISPADASAETWVKCGIQATGQGDRYIVFSCTVKPTVDVEANVIIFN